MTKKRTHSSTEFKGRLNRKFCSEKCKNAYHNEVNRDRESVVRNLNKTLHKNWVILQELYNVSRSKPVNINILESNGFKTQYHTHIHNSPIGEKYTMVYDYGFKNYFDNQVQIVKD